MTSDPLQPPSKFPQVDPTAPSDPATPSPVAAENTATTTDPGTRPVKTSEVIAYGKKKCPACSGRGMFDVRNVPGGVSQPKVCGCAIPRFLKANAKNLTLHKETGSWFWST